jgi:hypothetical protein
VQSFRVSSTINIDRRDCSSIMKMNHEHWHSCYVVFIGRSAVSFLHAIKYQHRYWMFEHMINFTIIDNNIQWKVKTTIFIRWHTNFLFTCHMTSQIEIHRLHICQDTPTTTISVIFESMNRLVQQSSIKQRIANAWITAVVHIRWHSSTRFHFLCIYVCSVEFD